MPSVTTMLYPAPAYVRVEANWADVGSATGVAVYRVDCITGERVPLRPYVSFNGDFLDLSCGYGIFWDTEPQLDRCVYYCTQAIDAAGNVVTAPVSAIAGDTFTRSTASTWGAVESGVIAGQVYTLIGGVVGNYSTNGAKGLQTQSTVNVLRQSVVTTDGGAKRVTCWFNVSTTATGAALSQRIWVGTDSNNNYTTRVDWTTTGTVTVGINKLIAAVGNVVAGAVTLPVGYVAGTQFIVELTIFPMGSVSVTAWAAVDPRPITPTLTATVTDPLTFVQTGLASRAEAGNTNVNPVLAFDNFTIEDPCADPTPVEVCSDDLVVPSSGDFRLGDPVRPCNDVTLLFDAPIDPDCVPTQGIFFGNMAEETFPANSGAFVPVNSRYPIVANRARGASVSTLTVASKTFQDRDAMRTLNDPGSPLLLRGPAQYGIDDRYMSVADVTENRPVSDHRVPPRVITLPHAEMARPSGPTQGVCGTRVDDLCDIYPTWDALIAAGLTYADLLRGKASNDTPIPDLIERTWDDVNSTYANWTAVNTGNTDWDDLRDGA